MFPTTSLRTEAGRGPGGRVGSAIAAASARTGVDFDYLVRQARIESGFNPEAKARTSSATGLYQFIEQTWLGTVKEHGASHGLGWAADSIRQSGGRYHVADAATRRAILDLRKDPEAASAMAAEFAADNRAYLEDRLGRPAESVDLYLAHFLGAGGATQFLRAYDANPDASAAYILPEAAAANRSIFYDDNGAPRSVSEIRDRFAAKLGGDSGPLPAMMRPAPAPAPLPQAQPRFGLARHADAETGIRPIGRPSAEYARVAYEMLANIGTPL
jgi:hypothetical protein